MNKLKNIDWKQIGIDHGEKIGIANGLVERCGSPCKIIGQGVNSAEKPALDRACSASDLPDGWALARLNIDHSS